MKKIAKDDACFFTQQPFLIGTYDPEGAPRFATISWISYTFGPPACLVVSMYGKKHTRDNIERAGQFTAGLVTPELLPLCEHFNRATHRPDPDAGLGGAPGPDRRSPAAGGGQVQL